LSKQAKKGSEIRERGGKGKTATWTNCSYREFILHHKGEIREEFGAIPKKRRKKTPVDGEQEEREAATLGKDVDGHPQTQVKVEGRSSSKEKRSKKKNREGKGGVPNLL